MTRVQAILNRNTVAAASLGAIAYGCYQAWAPLAWIVTGALLLSGLVFSHVTTHDAEGADDA